MLAATMNRLMVGGGLLLATSSSGCGQPSSGGASSSWHYVQWLDPSTIVSDGGVVTAWTDKSGLGNDLTGYFAPPFPTLTPLAANNENAVTFVITDSGAVPFVTNPLSIAKLPGFSWGQDDFAMEVVARLGPSSIGYDVWGGGYVASCCAAYTSALLAADGGIAAETSKGAAGTETIVMATGDFGDGAFHLLGARRYSGVLEIRIDGTPRGTVADSDSVSAEYVEIGGWPGDYTEVRVIRGSISNVDLIAI